MDGIATNKIKRITSQSDWVFFCIELSGYLMRKEDNGTLKAKKQQYCNV